MTFNQLACSNHLRSAVALLTITIGLASGLDSVHGWQADDQDAVDASRIVEQAVENLAGKQKYELRYRMQAGDEMRWSVEHTTATKTQMAGESEETSSRSQSVKKWRVLNVDATGNMTFEHSIESVKMWQKIGENEPQVFDSSQPADQAAAQFQAVAKSVGVPIATFTVTPSGQIRDKKSPIRSARFGIGEVLIPLPENPVPVGHKWYVPTQFQVTNEQGHVERLSARIMYHLAKVVDHKAFIEVRTQVLTPIESDKVRSQLMQQLNSGYAVLDLEQGILVHKEFEWNEKVQQVHLYEGSDGFLQYLAKLTEKRIKPSAVEPKVAPVETASQPLKLRDGSPVLRK